MSFSMLRNDTAVRRKQPGRQPDYYENKPISCDPAKPIFRFRLGGISRMETVDRVTIVVTTTALFLFGASGREYE